MPKETTRPKRKAAEKAEKATGTKAKKDTKTTKRPLSAYMLFSQDWRERIKEENPEASFGEIGKLLGAKWRALDDDEKKPYTDQAAKAKERADGEKTAHTSSKKSAANTDEEEE